MPRFSYRAKDHTLHVVEGTIEAESEAAAISRLSHHGIYPISLVEAGTLAATTPQRVRRRLSPETLAYTTHQLADLLAGGLPLLNALTLLANQTEEARLRRVIEQVADAVRDGQSLSEALAARPDIFPPLYRSLVKAGETGGGIEQALSRLAELGEREAELRSRVLSAAAYPLFVLVIAIAMVAFLMAYVIPKLSLVFLETDQVLPLPTRILLAISHVVVAWWWVLAAAVAAAVLAVRRWSARAQGKLALDRLIIAVPALGPLVRKLETARLARNLGMMVGQGVPILQALEVAVGTIDNALLRLALQAARDAVREGSSLAAALAATGRLPAFATNMIAVGEESGTADRALLKVAATYEREADRALRVLTTILEPVLLLLVGGVVMFIVLAMLLPVFQIGLGVQ